MQCNDFLDDLYQDIKRRSWKPAKAAPKSAIECKLPEQHETLAIALHLLDHGDAIGADELLTAATLEDPTDTRLWLATGICRMRRGAVRSAAAAFEMAACHEVHTGSTCRRAAAG